MQDYALLRAKIDRILLVAPRPVVDLLFDSPGFFVGLVGMFE